MGRFTGRLSMGFAAGCCGALAGSVLAWFLGDAGLPQRLGVRLAPVLTAEWLYPRLVWGGIWGLVLLLPFFRSSHVLRGLVFSLLPSAFSLLVVLPGEGGGMFGMGFGALTPFFVVFYNAVWGIVAGFWYAAASGDTRRL